MPTNLELAITTLTLPSGFCPTSEQERLNQYNRYSRVVIPGVYSQIVFQANPPDADDRDKAWGKIDVNGRLERIYTYFSGGWFAMHETPAGGSERRIWVGSEADLWSYDGGDGSNPAVTIPSETSGAMWERDTAFNALFPVGVGTFAAAGSIAVGGNTTDSGQAGEDRHQLTEAELAEHTHDVTISSTARMGYDGSTSGLDQGTSSRNLLTEDFPFTATVELVGEDTAHNNLPPMIGVYFIMRTIRVYRQAA